MTHLELLQNIQFLIFLFVTFFLVYNIVHTFKFSFNSFYNITDTICISTVILYMRNLYVVNYTVFHKYEIWRYYRHSKLNNAASYQFL